jgi:hypothetical protein
MLRTLYFAMIPSVMLLAADPFTGTWKLNWQESRTSESNPPPPPRQVLVTYSGEGQAMKVIVQVTLANGVERTIEHAVPNDGKEHSRYVGAPEGETMTSRRIDSFTEESVQKKDGRITVVTRRSVSPDGKRMTATARSSGADGTSIETVSVYDKQ